MSRLIEIQHFVRLKTSTNVKIVKGLEYLEEDDHALLCQKCQQAGNTLFLHLVTVNINLDCFDRRYCLRKIRSRGRLRCNIVVLLRYDGRLRNHILTLGYSSILRIQIKPHDIAITIATTITTIIWLRIICSNLLLLLTRLL